jgi:pimeloyl-ACP methyl ester carboxylesterase
VTLDLIGLHPMPVRPPEGLRALVLGAAGDRLVSREAVEATARSFGTRAEILPGLGHAMMLDCGWEAAARRILGWLEAL